MINEQLVQLLKGKPKGEMVYITGGRAQGKSYFQEMFVKPKEESIYDWIAFDEAELMVQAARCGGKTETLLWQEYWKLADMFPSYVCKMSKGKQPRLIRIKQSI